MAHVSKEKKETVNKLVTLLIENPIVGAVNIENLPASALQKMRAKLRGKAEIFMTKRRLMKVAIAEAEKSRKGINAIVDQLKGMPALLFTKENPFAIYKTIKDSKSPAAAKAGQIAPKDIEIKAGTTPFLPGPVIGELGALGLKTGVEGGKVAIKEDKVVVREGEEIKANVASILSRLGIEPMEIGLDITAIYENGIMYDKKVLDIDEDKFNNDFNSCIIWAQNLAIDAGYICKETIEPLIGKATRSAKSVALKACITEPGIINDLIAKANAEASSLKHDYGG